MNKQPVSYKQTDKRWKDKPYRVKGENSTIGGSGCGPSCAAMLIETITGRTYTPVDACRWSIDHGYKALNQGTYYSYFKPQFAAFGIECDQLSWANTYGKPTHEVHKIAAEKLKQGYYLIALMSKGLWTSSGHFVVIWWEDGKVRINDPASSRAERQNGDINTFRSQAKYYWWVDARNHNKQEEDEDMTQEKFTEMMNEYLSNLGKQDGSEWSKDAREWSEEAGLIKGDENGNAQWKSFMTREQMVTIMQRMAEK